jgi:NAD(P)H-flavin reductase
VAVPTDPGGPGAHGDVGLVPRVAGPGRPEDHARGRQGFAPSPAAAAWATQALAVDGAAPRPEPMAPRRYRVRARRRELADTVTLVLDPVDEPIAAHRPGQFNMLYAFAVGEAAISVSARAEEGGALLHTVRAVGATSRALCATRPGEVLGVRGPFGTSWGVGDGAAGDVVVVAGGLGLAPLRPAIHELLAERERFGRISLLMGARSPETLLYRRELEAWRSQLDLHVEATVDAADASWRGHVGLVTRLLDQAPFDPANTLALACGPEVMMRFTAQALVDRGVPAGAVRVSLERNMKCAIAFCGHCQLGPTFICRDGPVFPWSRVERLLALREV